MYSALTVALHPLTVAKIRRQVLKNNGAPPPSDGASSGSLFANARQYYRGLGVVVSLAIPARIIYISTLEWSRELVDSGARELISNPPSALAPYGKEMLGLLPLVTPLSGGVAGGLAAVSSQMIVVPMDVVSQKLMVMENSVYEREGSASKVARSIVKSDGWRGLYRGFGLSLFTSLPAGSIWWATYAGCKDQLSAFGDPDVVFENDAMGKIPPVVRQGIVQVTSAFSAAVAASVLTQPVSDAPTFSSFFTVKIKFLITITCTCALMMVQLDTIKTRIQVGKKLKLQSLSELASTPGLYKGLLPRITHMGVWGSVLSAAYEVLKLVSRKDYEL